MNGKHIIASLIIYCLTVHHHWTTPPVTQTDITHDDSVSMQGSNWY